MSGMVDPQDQRDEEQQALCGQARTLIEALRLSTAPAETLARAGEAVASALALLGPHVHGGPYAQADLLGGLGKFEETTDPMALFPYSPIVGRGNPIAPPVEFRVEEGVVHGRARFGAQYCGPPNHVHGGVVAGVMDELLGVVNVVNGVGAMTGTLKVRYNRPTPLFEEIRMEGQTAGTDGRKVYARGEMWHGDVLLAESEGTFIQIGDDFRAKMGWAER
ncbi:MAG: PaaI family thioesterase [Myxococcota bacterium]|jgi:acyl-coenzyme A thioesterase PaaI-like protein|nr:PaaI family thioesterase [Myxococcota bacterium]